jgi:cell division protein FtsA
VAEKVKIEFGSALPKEINRKEDINLSEIDSNEEGMVSRHHVAEIIEARLEEIFNLVIAILRSCFLNLKFNRS